MSIIKQQKRTFASPIRFFGSDEIKGMKKAIDIVLTRAAEKAKKHISLKIYANAIEITDDGVPLDIDYCEDDESWGYEKIFNHSIDIDDEICFGLAGDELLTLIQITAEHMCVKTYDGENESSVEFENGVSISLEPNVFELDKKRFGTSIKWSFDSSLFIDFISDIPQIYYQEKLSELVMQYRNKLFELCFQINSKSKDQFEYSFFNENIKTTHLKMRG